MTIRIGSNNPESLNAQRNLARAEDGLSKVSEALSSGLRINHASDDAAGLAVSASLKTDTRIYSQAIRNINDGVSMLSIAQGALEQLSQITIRQKELVEQAASGSYSNEQRKAMHTEANALVDEFNRITSTTSFNGVKLLDGSMISGTRIQAGKGTDESISFSLGSDLARTIGDGTFATFKSADNSAIGGVLSSQTVDLNGDGNVDMIALGTSGVGVSLGNGDGTFRLAVSYQTSVTTQAFSPFILADFNNDGIIDLSTGSYAGKTAILLGNGDGSFAAPRSYTLTNSPSGSIATADFNLDGKLDLISSDYTNDGFSIAFGNGDGSFKATVSYSGVNTPGSIATGDLNNDGIPDAVIASYYYSSFRIALGNGDGTFRYSQLSGGGTGNYEALIDVDGDNNLDVVYRTTAPGGMYVSLGNGDGTFKAVVSSPASGVLDSFLMGYGDINGDGVSDFGVATSNGSSISVFLYVGNSNGSFKAATSIATPAGVFDVSFDDINNDGVQDLVLGQYNGGTSLVALGNSTKATSILHLDLRTQSRAVKAMSTVDATLARVEAELGKIGSIQSRFEVATRAIGVEKENYSAAASRITDIDVAEASSDYIRQQILIQASASVLSQVNQSPALALKLLQN